MQDTTVNTLGDLQYLSEECVRTPSWYLRQQGLRKCSGELIFREITRHTEFLKNRLVQEFCKGGRKIN
jgi:hypothetical protein